MELHKRRSGSTCLVPVPHFVESFPAASTGVNIPRIGLMAENHMYEYQIKL
jgi:hypothetical protein